MVYDLDDASSTPGFIENTYSCISQLSTKLSACYVLFVCGNNLIQESTCDLQDDLEKEKKIRQRYLGLPLSDFIMSQFFSHSIISDDNADY